MKVGTFDDGALVGSGVLILVFLPDIFMYPTTTTSTSSNKLAKINLRSPLILHQIIYNIEEVHRLKGASRSNQTIPGGLVLLTNPLKAEKPSHDFGGGRQSIHQIPGLLSEGILSIQQGEKNTHKLLILTKVPAGQVLRLQRVHSLLLFVAKVGLKSKIFKICPHSLRPLIRTILIELYEGFLRYIILPFSSLLSFKFVVLDKFGCLA